MKLPGGTIFATRIRTTSSFHPRRKKSTCCTSIFCFNASTTTKSSLIWHIWSVFLGQLINADGVRRPPEKFKALCSSPNTARRYVNFLASSTFTQAPYRTVLKCKCHSTKLKEMSHLTASLKLNFWLLLAVRRFQHMLQGRDFVISRG